MTPLCIANGACGEIGAGWQFAKIESKIAAWGVDAARLEIHTQAALQNTSFNDT
jgi:hypothetical protein